MFTNAGVSGAVMEPTLPSIEEKANRLCLYLVGYSSAVYTYIDVTTIEMQYLPIKYTAMFSTSSPEIVKRKSQYYLTI